MMVTFISGMVPPHWKLRDRRRLDLAAGHRGWFWFGLNSCAAPKICTSTRRLVVAFTSAANCSRFIAEWCAGGNWWLIRMV